MYIYVYIYIYKADKGSFIVVCDCEDYIVETEKQLCDKNVYSDVNFESKILQDLAEKSNEIFEHLKRKGKGNRKRT